MAPDAVKGSVEAGLEALCRTAGLEGAATLEAGAEGTIVVTHRFGGDFAPVAAEARALLARDAVGFASATDGRAVLACPWEGRLTGGRRGGLVLWRTPNGARWTAADRLFGAGVAALIGVMARQGATEPGLDALTGVPNRLYFLAEVDRHIGRLDRDGQAGTMMVVDLDPLRRVNALFGRAAGDRMLIRIAGLLRAMVRPGDIVGRVDGDAFAVWTGGMDHMTAAERAENLVRRRIAMDDRAEEEEPGRRQTLSIGIAERSFGMADDARGLLRRARIAADAAGEAGGDGWRVALA